MHPTLQALYTFFKPRADTVVWGNGKDEVCVAWQFDIHGYMRWYLDCNSVVRFEYVKV